MNRKAPRLGTVKIRRAAHGDRSFVVNVYDALGQLICWCGPYTIRERDRCLDLFRSAGWVKRSAAA